MRSLYFFILSFCFLSTQAQFILNPGKLPAKASLIPYSILADVGRQNLDIDRIDSHFQGLKPWPLKGEYGNLGFTDHNYWIRFQIQNKGNRSLHYFLEVAEPMTDHLNLYLFKGNNLKETQRNGDNLPFSARSIPYRKPIFHINLEPGETKTGYLEIKNDGEKNNLPLNLISDEEFLKTCINDQIILGLFYGIILMVVITYSFFYFALKEKSFLYYSLYVLTAGLCHFSLDGLFHQYIDRSNSWLNLHAVLLFAIPASYFFGKYSEIILDIKGLLPQTHKIFKILYRFLALTFIGLLLAPPILKLIYPTINILTLVGILLISFSIIQILYKKQTIDRFYFIGIMIMFLSFILVILLNFGIISYSLSVDNITKMGIGLEIIALSLSMANRIRILKTKKEEMQALALAKSEEMNEVKTHFLSNMSHELRTPLNAILGITQILEKEDLNAAWRNNLELIKSASFHLVSSVNDILDFSMMENGQLKLQEIDFSPFEIIEKINKIYKVEAENKGLEYVFRSNLSNRIVVSGDPNRLEQVIQNILQNAIKFTLTGKVSFEIDSEQNGPDKIVIRFKIQDTGIGISPRKLSNIFDMFSQVDINNKRKFGGFGIGLCVSKALVELQKGTLNIESKLNSGTLCTIELTYSQSQKIENPVILRIPDSYDLFGKRILLVEDNPMNQMVIKLIVKKWRNTEISYAMNGKEGLEVLTNEKIDLVLMDLQMPVMDGYECIERIRLGDAGKENQEIPIILVTADITEEAKIRVQDLGIKDFMTKPIQQDQLYSKIYACLYGETIIPLAV